MTQPPLQNTRFNQLQTSIGERLLGQVTPAGATKAWPNRPIRGRLPATNVDLYLSLLVQSLGALGLLLFLIRLRQRCAGQQRIGVDCIDNFRIGFLPVVLEAFKIG